MKTFITTVPGQKILPNESKEVFPYESDVPVFDHTIQSSFPIIPMINGVISPGETFKTIIICTTGHEDHNYSEENYHSLKGSIEDIAHQKGGSCLIERFEIPSEECAETHLVSFMKLIEQIQENSEIYAEITHNRKTTSIIEIMALNYAYQFKGSSVKYICYAEELFDNNTSHKKAQKKIYDITSLFLMNQIVNTLAKSEITDPLPAIQSVINTFIDMNHSKETEVLNELSHFKNRINHVSRDDDQFER